MLPSRFHVSPFLEISSSRLIRPSTIHFCSVVSSRNAIIWPSGLRTSHSRPCGPLPSVVVARGGGRFGRRTLKTWPHAVHLTVTPLAPTRSSSNSYSVLHFSQRTSIERG